MRPTSMTPLLAALVLFAPPQRASAVAQIPVIYGHGDTITHVSELPADSPARMPGKIVLSGNPTNVGYKYYRLHVFWVPFWTSTSKGEFVAYNESGILSTRYEPLGTDPQEVSTKTGVPVSQLTIPWTARNPWGLYLLIGGLVAWGVVVAITARRRKRPTGQAAVYQQAPREAGQWVTVPVGLGIDGKDGVLLMPVWRVGG